VKDESDLSFEMKAYGDRPEAFKIGLAPIPVSAWFEDSDHDPWPRKAHLLETCPSLVWGETPGSLSAQEEALEMIAAWTGRRPGLSTTTAPLLRAAALVEDDLCLMERRDGPWILTAASLFSGSFFTPAAAVGLALGALHQPVPGFDAGFLTLVARIFDHLAPDLVLQRRNWSLVASGDLSLPDLALVRRRIQDLAVDDAPTALFIRSERQTIRRLPQSGAILFTIRIWREAFGEVLSRTDRRLAFASAFRAALDAPDGAVSRYKGLALYAPLVLPWLA
jgi:hypothetical protein